MEDDVKSSAPRKARTQFTSEEMVVQLYRQLRSLAAAKLARLPQGQTLQATALVHDAYIRLAGNSDQKWKNKGHFFAAASEAMRRILVEQARRKSAARRGNNPVKRSVHQLEIKAPDPDNRVIEVSEALEELEAEDAVKAQIVKLRFFAGLGHEEIARLLEVSEKTVRRHWSFAKVWLFERIKENR